MHIIKITLWEDSTFLSLLYEASKFFRLKIDRHTDPATKILLEKISLMDKYSEKRGKSIKEAMTMRVEAIKYTKEN